MNIFVSVGAATINTATSVIVTVSYFVGNVFGSALSLNVSVGLATLMNLQIMNACIADASASGYTVGLLDLRVMQGGFTGL